MRSRTRISSSPTWARYSISTEVFGPDDQYLASDDGSVIWLFGFEDDGPTALTLSTSTIEDYRASAPKDIAISTYEDGARVIMAKLESKRRAQFGLEFDMTLASRFGVVFQDSGVNPLIGLFYFNHFGGIHTRVDGRWEMCRVPVPGPERDDCDDRLPAPILKSGVARSMLYRRTMMT